MTNETKYVCPGCAAHNLSEECSHRPVDWELAEALRDGVERAHSDRPHSWEPIEGAWLFVDDAQNLAGDVGEPPYRVEVTHPTGGGLATVGCVNARYLLGLEEGEGDTLIGFLVDLHELGLEFDA